MFKTWKEQKNLGSTASECSPWLRASIDKRWEHKMCLLLRHVT